MSFLFTLIFGFVHLCTFVLTKSMTNYAAFTASRALLVGGSREFAARQVMSEIQWWPGGLAANMARVAVQERQNGPRLADGRRRRGVRVDVLAAVWLSHFSERPWRPWISQGDRLCPCHHAAHERA